MARLYSDLGQRTVYLPNGLAKAQGLPCLIYRTQPGSPLPLLANLAAYDPDDVDTPGAPIVGAALTVDAYSNRPPFWDVDDLPVLWITVNGGPMEPIYPDAQPQLTALTTRVGTVEGTAAAAIPAAQKGAAGGVADLDNAGKLPASQMRPFVDRGPVAASTAYNPWDLVVYQGRRVLITTATTSSATKFISAANYVVVGPAMWVSVKDHGAKGDAVTDDTAAIQAAIDYVAATSAQTTFGGGTVFLPAGMYIVSSTIVLKKHVWLRGEGMISTSIKLATNANCDVIRNDVAPTSSGANADVCGLVDLQVDGNRLNQSGAGPFYGVRFETNPAVTAAAGDSYFDMHHTVQNVRVYRAKGTGFRFIGRSAIQVVRAFAYDCTEYGFQPTFDTTLSQCESDLAGKAGFYINNGSVRLVGCKSFKSGQVDHVGAGFELGANANGVALAGCEAQNNYGQGFYLNGANRCTIQGVADSNNFDTAGTFPGVELLSSSNSSIDVVCWQGTQGGSQVGYQRNALRMTGSSGGNGILLSHSAVAPATVSSALTGDTVLGSTNSVTVNGVSVTRTLAGDVDVTIANPTDGQTLTYDAASGKWKNLPSGSTAFFAGALGDGSDSAATLDGAATVGWASKSGSTYTMTRDCHTTTLTVASGVTLIPNGYRIFCTGTVTNNGTIAANGNPATSFTAATGTGTGALSGGRPGGVGNTAAGGGGTAGGVGVANAGAGGTGASGAGGSGGGSSTSQAAWWRQPQPLLAGAISVFGTVSAPTAGGGGGGGGGDGTNRGGGGGSGGGIVPVFARAMVNAGAITAIGGNGFTPTVGNCGGGGGGAGGLVLIYTLSAWTNTGTTSVTGGAPGSGVGTGTAGVVGGNGNVLTVVLA